VTGTFIFGGNPPQLRPKAFAGGAAACGPAAIPDETLLVDPDSKGIANVFI
jgi:hypothetical protein